ncbi:hypothetical protein DL98DRAFT_265712 [Cadophora sp. DSE1049]|nr:hypothetical protein DL98DRAFT_265712 [Cadophora sp. DSE1049]
MIEHRSFDRSGQDLHLSYMASLWLSAFLDSQDASQGCNIVATSNYTSMELQQMIGEEAVFTEPSNRSISRVLPYLSLQLDHYTPYKFLGYVGKRLSPMRSFILSGYYWRHHTYEATLIWDFSELESLYLDSIILEKFFVNIPVEDFQSLLTSK